MFTLKEFFYILPELFLLVSAVLLVLLYPLTLIKKEIKIGDKIELVNFHSISEFKQTLILIYISTIFMLQMQPSFSVLLFEQQYIITPLTQLAKILVLICVIVLLLIAPYQSRFIYWEEQIILTIFIVISSMFMISANDYLTLWLASELQTFSFVIGMTFFRQNEKALQSATTYFIVSALMSSFFLLGIWLIYGILGTINFSDQVSLMDESNILERFPIITIGHILILSYFFFKLAVAPLHLWTLTFFMNSNLFIVYQIATISKISAIIPCFQLISLFLHRMDSWFWISMVIALVSIVVGAFGAFKEDNIKRFLAYSSINHFGWILLPLSINDRHALQISFIYFIIYLILNVSLFTILFTAIPHTSEDTYLSIDHFSSISSLKNSIFYSALIILFSFVSIPPFLGFFSKVLIFGFFIKHGFIIIPILLIPLSAISAFYYLFLIILMITKQDIATATPISIKIINKIILISFAILHVSALYYIYYLLSFVEFLI